MVRRPSVSENEDLFSVSGVNPRGKTDIPPQGKYGHGQHVKGYGQVRDGLRGSQINRHAGEGS
jgi:hypothetical protein